MGDDRPSDAVLDELLRAFQADDLTQGTEIDLDSPEIEALLSGEVSRRLPSSPDGRAPEEAPEADHDADAADAAGGAATDADQAGQDGAAGAAGAADGGATDTDHGGAGKQTVVISDDAALPDPVYIEGDLNADSAGDSKTVFIDDGSDDVGEIVGSAEAARVTGIEPKLRERRVAVQRAAGRKRLRWVLVAIFVPVLIIAALAVFGSSMFSIDEVRVEGAVYSREPLQEIVDDLRGEPVLRVDTHAFEERIEAIPWVLDARVSTTFPDRARIEVSERKPMAWFAGADGKFRIVDIDGRVLDVIAGEPVEYVEVTADAPPNTSAGQMAPIGFANAARLVRYMPPEVSRLTERIEVTADGSEIHVMLEGGTDAFLGDGQELGEKLVRLVTAIDRSDGDLPDVLDVSTDQVTSGSE